MNKEILLNKATLLNALNDYLVGIQIDPIGDIISKVNAIETCRNYVAAIDDDVVNADWVKSNCIIILPAIDYQRKALKKEIDDAQIINDEKALSKARAEYRNLQPFLNLLKPFRTLIS